MHILRDLFIVLFAGTVMLPAQAEANYSQREDVQQFIEQMVSKHQFDKDKLTQWFAEATKLDSVLTSISKPAEKTLTWKQYRPIFITSKRIEGGVQFMKDNRELLQRAQKEYGVPAHLIAAIIGVETYYGKRSGGTGVFDSLTTLGFDYPPRAKFFRSELEQFLLLAREEDISVKEIQGSYAGAMGMPQFISSSYRHYAVDFDGDGKRDLWNNKADVIGSVANYFKMHGWVKNQPVVYAASADKKIKDSGRDKLKPYTTIAQLRELGVVTDAPVDASTEVTLITFDGAQGEEHWLGLKNFYVITRYNHSALYAMAVHQLSQELLAQAGD
ncbi:MAG: lytic murein transglycosylase B [Gammaproteobacteria bacterium]